MCYVQGAASLRDRSRSVEVVYYFGTGVSKGETFEK
jgi:hypothetical protein